MSIRKEKKETRKDIYLYTLRKQKNSFFIFDKGKKEIKPF